jgi:hypothetical protein
VLVVAAVLFSVPEDRGASEDMKNIRLTSDAFKEGAAIPRDYTCDGFDRSPALHWEGAPAQTKAFALVCEDPDAPAGVWTHWLIYNIPGASRALDEGVAPKDTLGDGTRQGKNDFGKIGFGGPCPPRGSNHRYFFKLFALSEPVAFEPGAGRQALLDAVKGKTLGEGQLMGRYER